MSDPPSPSWTPPPAWGTPVHVPSAPARLPWYRSTAFLILGGAALLGLGGVAGAGAAALAFVAADDGAAGEDDLPEVATYGGPDADLRTFALGPGQCSSRDPFDTDAYPEGDAVDCEQRHAVEHYAAVDVPRLSGDVAARFDLDALQAFADQACYLAFQPYVGLGYDDSELSYLPVLPSEQAWDEGARTIHCLLYAFEGTDTTGSANASRR